MKQFVVVAQKLNYNKASMEELINSKTVVSVCFDSLEEAQEVVELATQTQGREFPVDYSVMEFELDVEADGIRMQAQLDRKGEA